MCFLKYLPKPIRSEISGGLTGIALLGAIGESLVLGVLYLQQYLIDSGICDAGRVQKLFIYCLAVLFCICLFQCITTLLRIKLLAKRREVRSARLFSNQMARRSFNKTSIGSQETSVLDRLSDEFDRGILKLFSSIFRAVGAIVYAACISVWFALASVVLLASAMWFAKWSTQSMPVLGAKSQKAGAQFLDQQRSLVENLQNFTQLGLESRLLKRFRKLDGEYLSSRQHLMIAASRANTGAVVAYGVQKVALIVLLAFLYSIGVITAGQLIAGVFLVTLISMPITQFTNALASIRGSKELFKVLEPEITQPQNIKVSAEPKRINLQVNELRSISGDILLHNSQVLLNRGKFYTLTGENGSGKSTLLKELYWVLVDNGISVTYLDQSAQLFPGTVRDNLSWSKNNDSAYQLWQNICPHIGLDTPISRGSKGLSAGERQKLLLARTMASGHDVVLLDEGIRSLDVKSQTEIVKTIQELAENTNSIVILSVHPDSDEIGNIQTELHLENQNIKLRSSSDDKGASYVQ